MSFPIGCKETPPGTPEDEKKITGTSEDLCRAVRSGDIERVRLLVSAGVDVNAKDKDGNTALHVAAGNGHAEIVELLIAKGADVNAQGYFGRTPLHRASAADHKKIAELLIASGAEVNAKDD